MQVINKIDHLITDLTELKPALSDDSSINEKKFNELLTASMATSFKVTDESKKAEVSQNEKTKNEIPSWVDPDYGYDPLNPRKPNIRELMEAMSGKNLEDLYSETNESWKKIRQTASEMLYGVVGGNEDTRDWQSIMSSKDIVGKAEELTGTM